MRKGAVAAAIARLRAGVANAWQLARGLAGERAYENYLAHQRRMHPDEPVLSEREFWRQHVDAGDRNPQSRCC